MICTAILDNPSRLYTGFRKLHPGYSLNTSYRRLLVVFGLDHRDRDIGLVVKNVIRPLATTAEIALHINAAIDEADYFTDLLLHVPASFFQRGWVMNFVQISHYDRSIIFVICWLDSYDFCGTNRVFNLVFSRRRRRSTATHG